MSSAASRIPVLIGAGQINDRAAEGGLDSLQLMIAAVKAAAQDCGGAILPRVDWLGIVPQLACPEYGDLTSLVPQGLGIAPAHVEQAPLASGDTPIRFLNDAANAIGEGKAEAAIIVGGEALRMAARRAAAKGETGGIFKMSKRTASTHRQRYGLINPAEIYPLYENAGRAAYGQSLEAGQAETGLIWSLMAEVAAENEGAWIHKRYSPQDITEPRPDNRLVAFPYTKLMVANSSVNQGAAVIVASLAVAREIGVPEERLIYIGRGAAAHEAEDPLARTRWDEAAGMTTALRRVMEINGLRTSDLDAVEFYSCFPCVPKMARRVLNWPADRPVTAHGGLTFGGGPIGNYMTHATASMANLLRKRGSTALLFANGGHATHNRCIVLTRVPQPAGLFPQDYDYQKDADDLRGAVSPLTDAHETAGQIETYTVVYDREGKAQYGVVLARGDDRERIIAKVRADDFGTLDLLTSGKREPVGTRGAAKRDGDALIWHPVLD